MPYTPRSRTRGRPRQHPYRQCLNPRCLVMFLPMKGRQRACCPSCSMVVRHVLTRLHRAHQACPVCGTMFRVSYKQRQRHNNGSSQHNYCSQRCAIQARWQREQTLAHPPIATHPRSPATIVEWLMGIAWREIGWEPVPHPDKRVPYSLWSPMN